MRKGTGDRGKEKEFNKERIKKIKIEHFKVERGTRVGGNKEG